MTVSNSIILGGVIAAFLLGFGVGFLIKAMRQVVNIAANVD